MDSKRRKYSTDLAKTNWWLFYNLSVKTFFSLLCGFSISIKHRSGHYRKIHQVSLDEARTIASDTNFLTEWRTKHGFTNHTGQCPFCSEFVDINLAQFKIHRDWNCSKNPNRKQKKRLKPDQTRPKVPEATQSQVEQPTIAKQETVDFDETTEIAPVQKKSKQQDSSFDMADIMARHTTKQSK